MQSGQVFVEDETTLAYGTYQLTWKMARAGGNGAEIVVERPYGDNGKNYPLANYIWDFALVVELGIKGTDFTRNDDSGGHMSPDGDDNDTQVMFSAYSRRKVLRLFLRHQLRLHGLGGVF